MPSVDELVIRPARLGDEEQVRRANEVMAAEGFPFLLGPDLPYRQVLERLALDERGLDLRPGRVPCSYRVAVLGDTIVGRVSVRHELNDSLRIVGGHVGYGVLPEHRGRGYAKAMLRWGLADLASRGVERALVTCDDDNPASFAVIEACGGVLEDTRVVPESPVPIRRYWIDTTGS